MFLLARWEASCRDIVVGGLDLDVDGSIAACIGWRGLETWLNDDGRYGVITVGS